MTAVNIPTVMQYTVCEYACHVLPANQEHTLLTAHTHTHTNTHTSDSLKDYNTM